MPMVGRGDFAAAACFVMAALYACGSPLTTGEWPAESPSNRHLVVRAGVAEGGEAFLSRGRPRRLTGCRPTARLASPNARTDDPPRGKPVFTQWKSWGTRE